MHLPVIILNIDSDYKITYWIIRDGVKIVSPVTIPQTIQLLNTFEFDLIVSEPQKLAILKSPFKVNDPNDHEKSGDALAPLP